MSDRTIEISTDLVENRYVYELPPGVTNVRAVYALGDGQRIRLNHWFENGFLSVEKLPPHGRMLVIEYDDPRPLWRAIFEKVRDVFRFWYLKFRTAVKGD